MKINILNSQIVLNDDPELEGITLTIFLSGCDHACKNCHNPVSWDPKNGTIIDIKEIEDKIDDSVSLIKSLCFCGGEPLLQPEAVRKLTNKAKSHGLKTILYTGYLFEEISKDIREMIDIIIDGRYMDECYQTHYPASTNQRVFIRGQEVDPKTLSINQGGF